MNLCKSGILIHVKSDVLVQILPQVTQKKGAVPGLVFMRGTCEHRMSYLIGC